MRKLTAPGHAGLGALGALILGSTFAFVACAPAPMDAQTNTTRASGGSTGSSSGGSSGSSNGGSSGSSNGGSSGGSSTGGSSGGSSSGGSSGGSSTGGSSGGSSSGGSSGGSSSGGSSGSSSGGSSGSGSGGSSGGRMDAAAPADMGGGMAPANGTKVPADVQAVLMKGCARCHGGNWNDAAKSYERLKGNAMCGNMPRMKPGDGAGSLVIQKMKGPVAGCGAKMPPNGAAPTAEEIKLVEDWITAGAKPVP